jgi:hypothetical protein
MSRWYYVSFSDNVSGGFLGGAYVRGRSRRHVVARTRRLKIHPGGQALVVGPIEEALMEERVPADKRDRLLSLEEVREAEP